MLEKQSIISINSPTFKYFKPIAITAFFILAHVISMSCFAKPITAYGPVKSGQTLWEIAEETRPNNSISIEQYLFALYNFNPDAFKSGNMNLLGTGSIINIPDTNTILKTSNKEAKKQLEKHIHALDLLRADAKHLKRAKTRTQDYKLQVKKLQKKLGNYRYESQDWNKTYLQLVTAKRRYSKSTRNVAKLRRLLLEKASLKTGKSIKLAATNDKKITEVNTRLNQIQSKLDTLNESNSNLVEKVNALAKLENRVNILSEELGKNDEVVLELKNTMQKTQASIDQQIQTSKALQQRLNTVETNSSKYREEHKAIVENIKTEIESIKTPPQQNLLSKDVNKLIEKTDKFDIKNNNTDQLQAIIKRPENDTSTYWKIIVIGGFLNGVILIFILLRLLFNKQSQQLFSNASSNF